MGYTVLYLRFTDNLRQGSPAKTHNWVLMVGATTTRTVDQQKDC